MVSRLCPAVSFDTSTQLRGGHLRALIVAAGLDGGSLIGSG